MINLISSIFRSQPKIQVRSERGWVGLQFVGRPGESEADSLLTLNKNIAKVQKILVANKGRILEITKAEKFGRKPAKGKKVKADKAYSDLYELVTNECESVEVPVPGDEPLIQVRVQLNLRLKLPKASDVPLLQGKQLSDGAIVQPITPGSDNIEELANAFQDGPQAVAKVREFLGGAEEVAENLRKAGVADAGTTVIENETGEVSQS